MTLTGTMGDWFDTLAVNEQIVSSLGSDKGIYIQMDKIASFMKDELNKKDWYIPVAYTPHDFDHHVSTVLTYGSNLLSNSLRYFDADELVAFQYACIMHDIDMVYNPGARQKHAVNADIVLNPYSSDDIKKATDEYLKAIRVNIKDMSDSGSVKSDNIVIIENAEKYLQTAISFLFGDENPYCQAAGNIVLGHSDIKIKKLHINTLDKEYYKKKIQGPLYKKTIHTRVLAAILRLADELDCSKMRRHNISDVKIDKLDEDAKRYWKKLNLIESVEFDMPNINLNVNTNYIRKPENMKDECFELLYEIIEKITQEYEVVRQCIEEEKYNILIACPELTFNDDTMKAEYSEYVKKIETEKNYEYIPVPLKVIEDDIRNIIKEKNLIYDVHRKIRNRRMRNSFDCNGLLADRHVLDEISKAFVNYIYTGNFDKAPESMKDEGWYLVGVANSGVIITSQVAHMTGLPFIYYIPTPKKSEFSEQERKWNIYAEHYAGRRPIFITGESRTGDSLKEAEDFLAQELGESIEVQKIIGVINRESENNDESYLNIKKRSGVQVDFILNEYPVEWCRCITDEQCPYGRKLCKSDDEIEECEEEKAKTNNVEGI